MNSENKHRLRRWQVSLRLFGASCVISGLLGAYAWPHVLRILYERRDDTQPTLAELEAFAERIEALAEHLQLEDQIVGDPRRMHDTDSLEKNSN
jgi:hypothetical protein